MADKAYTPRLKKVYNETIRTVVKDKSASIFKKPQFDIVSFEDTQQAVKIYREEHSMIATNNVYQALKMADVQAIGKQLGTDYVFMLKVNNDAPRMSAGFFTVSFKTTITCDARVMNVAEGKYNYMKTFIKDGSSSAALGVPSFNNAYKEALGKALEEIKIDTNTL